MIVSFGVVIALVVFMSVYAIEELTSVNDTYHNVIEHPIEGKFALIGAQSAVRDMRRAVTAVVMYAPSNDMAKIDSSFGYAMEAFEESLRALETYDEAVRTNKRYDHNDINARVTRSAEIRRILNQYRSEVANPLIALSRQGLYEEAIALLEDSAHITTALRSTIMELLNDTDTGVGRQVNNAMEAADDAVMLLIIIAVAVVLISIALSLIVSSLLSKPVKKLVRLVEEVSGGNINVNTDRANIPKDEIGMLTSDTYELVDVIKSMISDLSKLNHEINTIGDMDYQMEVDKYQGSYKGLMEDINTLAKTFAEEISLILETIREVGKGNFHSNIRWLPGKKAVFNHQIITLMDQFNNINTEVVYLTKRVKEGKLDSKADSMKFHGEWRNLLDNLNILMDTITGPIQDVRVALSELEKANFKHRVTNEYQGDFDSMIRGLNTSFEATDSYITEVSSILTSMSGGDLTKEIKRNYIGQFMNIRESINTIAHSLNKTMGDISVTSEQVLAGSGQVSSSAMDLAQGSTEQASAVQELTSSIAEINEQTKENTANAQQSAELAKESKHNAETGNAEMHELMTAMEGISESSHKISLIIKTIEDIAFQTNLLALNAAVEAARAGEHGKGFAVVAEEVRTLASRSRDAAQTTNDLIQESITRVEGGAKSAKATAKTLSNIVENVISVAEVLDKIYNASAGQAAAINQVSEGIKQIAEIIQNNTATSEESAATAEELSSQAEMLKNMMSFFKTN